ncbi:Hsp20/alpha crystallin family protein [Gorillibacterium massiliense]|uniref:Hsp20/alpha crystallin family protein n=1 Tax=Gorillibacterium massiliense TaxID=1280390 RepID=UPI0004B8FF15|nr:Hsp20/alpha crystallin family protein [Gorillibacterium massiliense]
MADKKDNPWKVINDLMKGNFSAFNMKETLGNGAWIDALIADIMKRTKESISSGVRNSEDMDDDSPAAPPVWVDNHMRNVMQSVGSAQASSLRSVRSPRVTQSDKSVFVRFRLSGAEEADNIRVYAGRQTLRLAGLEGGSNLNVPLPTPVKVQGCKARISDNTLTVRLPKLSRGNERELPIEYN